MSTSQQRVPRQSGPATHRVPLAIFHLCKIIHTYNIYYYLIFPLSGEITILQAPVPPVNINNLLNILMIINNN